jgi:hypothetical protein
MKMVFTDSLQYENRNTGVKGNISCAVNILLFWRCVCKLLVEVQCRDAWTEKVCKTEHNHHDAKTYSSLT